MAVVRLLVAAEILDRATSLFPMGSVRIVGSADAGHECSTVALLLDVPDEYWPSKAADATMICSVTADNSGVAVRYSLEPR